MFFYYLIKPISLYVKSEDDYIDVYNAACDKYGKEYIDSLRNE